MSWSLSKIGELWDMGGVLRESLWRQFRDFQELWPWAKLRCIIDNFPTRSETYVKDREWIIRGCSSDRKERKGWR